MCYYHPADIDRWVWNHEAQRNMQPNRGLALLLFAQKNGSRVPTQEAPESRDSQRTHALHTPAEAESPATTAKEVPQHPGIQETFLSPFLSSSTVFWDFPIGLPSQQNAHSIMESTQFLEVPEEVFGLSEGNIY